MEILNFEFSIFGGTCTVTCKVIVFDSKNIERSTSVFGALFQSLKCRRQLGIPPFTIMSCDNLPGNGDVTKSLDLLVDKTKSANKGNKVHFTMIVHDKSMNVIWNKDAETKLTRQILDEVNTSLFAVNDLFETLKDAYQDIKPESFRKKLDREIEKLVRQEVLELVRSEKVKYVKRTVSNDDDI